MPTSHADRNLLYGILALQMNFVSQEALIRAMNAWVLEKHRPLGEILLARQALAPEVGQLLDALVAAHLKQHGNNPQQSLAAISSFESARQALAAVQDCDLQASLAAVGGLAHFTESAEKSVPVPLASNRDQDATQSFKPRSAEPGLRFRRLRPLAKGGLGEVFVAEDGELHREVALKEIQDRHADDSASRGRFLLEAEITGGLEHPGIVPIYGLGTYADGRPFYAMRLIKGDSLKEAIEQFHAGNKAEAHRESHPHVERADYTGLAFRQLLGRFIDVCNAVAYAHSRGVLHRDLKPGNIMLGKFGETLVVDWGLAKCSRRVPRDETCTHGALDEPTLRPSSGSHAETQTGAAIGTPAFMSPEQAQGRLDELGPATDVYSLGATLYALLTNRPPAEGELADILAQVSRSQIKSPREINPQIPKPLEAICKKAMAHRPTDRYATPRALADDLERWLADEPVLAHAEPFTLRTRRWLRKHPRTVTALAATLLVGLVSSSAIAWIEARNATIVAGKNQALDEANTQLVSKNDELQKSNAAEAQAKEDALAVIEFFQNNVLARARPEDQEGGLGIKATIREAIDTSEPDIAMAFQDRPLVEASLRNTLGLTYQYLGEAKLAIAQHQAARKLRESILGTDHPQTLTSMNNLAAAYESVGNFDLALPLYEETLKLSRTRLGQDHPHTLTSMNNLAAAYQSLGKLESALSLYEETLKLRREKLGQDHPQTLTSMNNLAAAYQSVGNFDLALPLYEETLKLKKAKLGAEHPETLASLNNLASAYKSMDKLDLALPLLAETLVHSCAILGPDHPNTLTTMNNLGVAYQSHGKLELALSLYEEALKLGRAKVGPLHPTTLNSMSALASAYLQSKQFDKAIPLFDELVRIQQRMLATDEVSFAGGLANIAMLLLQYQQFGPAETYLRECVEIRERMHADDWSVFSAKSLLGAALTGQKKFAEAEPLLLAGYEGLKQREAKIPPTAKVRLTEALKRLVDFYTAWEKPVEAAKWRKELEAKS